MVPPIEIGGASALPLESRCDIENGRLSDEKTLATERKESFVKDDEESSSVNRIPRVVLSLPQLRCPSMHILDAAKEFRRLGRKRQHNRDELNLGKRLQDEKEIKSAGIKLIGDILDRILFSCDEATLTAAMERTGQLFRKLTKSGKGVGWIADSELDPNSERGQLLRAMTRACVSLTEGLTLYESSSNIQMAGMAAIAEAAQCTPMLAVLGYQCCSVLDRAMRGMHKDEPRIQFAACYCIGAIAGTSHASKYILNSAGACTLVISAMMQFGPTDRDVAAASIWALHSLGKCHKLRKRLRDPCFNIPLALQGILKAHSSADARPNHTKLVSSVMESLLKFRECEKATLSALWALRNLSTTIVASREELRRKGLLEELIAILNTRVLVSKNWSTTMHPTGGEDHQWSVIDDVSRPWNRCKIVERVSGCMYALAKDVHCAKELIRLGMKPTLFLAAAKTDQQQVVLITQRVIKHTEDLAKESIAIQDNVNSAFAGGILICTYLTNEHFPSQVKNGIRSHLLDEIEKRMAVRQLNLNEIVEPLSGTYMIHSFNRGKLGPWQWPLNESDTSKIVALLDEGGQKVIITVDGSIDQAKELVQWVHQHFKQDVRSRLVARTGCCHNIEPFMEVVRPIIGTVQFVLGREIDSITLATSLAHLRGKEGSSEHLSVVFEILDDLEISEQCIGQCCAHVKATDSEMVEVPSSMRKGVDASSAFVACLKTDRDDGLFTTVVCDASGVALGLVYSSAKSIASAMSCGRGVYWSRSRNCLWRKGDSSGAWQKLLKLEVDCDSDAIRAIVIQLGNPPAFCHLNRRDCWGPDSGLGLLERTLSSRKASAPSGSYTARLFGDKNLLRNKLVEEAQELAEAETPVEVASEAADLMYFLMVRCVAAGVGMTDVEGWLDKRALKIKRRSGDAKAHMIDAADAILATEKKRKTT